MILLVFLLALPVLIATIGGTNGDSAVSMIATAADDAKMMLILQYFRLIVADASVLVDDIVVYHYDDVNTTTAY